MKTFKIIIMVCIMTFLGSCATMPTAKTSYNVDSLEGIWNLQNEGNPSYGIGNNPITLVFDPTTPDRIGGFAGCNNYGGEYNGQAGYIQFTNMYSTKMACPDLEEESQYLDLLGKINRFEIKGNNLYLYKDNLLFLHYKK